MTPTRYPVRIRVQSELGQPKKGWIMVSASELQVRLPRTRYSSATELILVQACKLDLAAPSNARRASTPSLYPLFVGLERLTWGPSPFVPEPNHHTP